MIQMMEMAFKVGVSQLGPAGGGGGGVIFLQMLLHRCEIKLKPVAVSKHLASRNEIKTS